MQVGVDFYNGAVSGDVAVTLGANSGQSANHAGPGVMAFKLGNGEKSRSIGLEVEVAPTLNSECGGNKPAILTVNEDGQTKN